MRKVKFAWDLKEKKLYKSSSDGLNYDKTQRLTANTFEEAKKSAELWLLFDNSSSVPVVESFPNGVPFAPEKPVVWTKKVFPYGSALTKGE